VEQYINTRTVVVMSWCPLRLPHTNDVRFVDTSSCLYEDSYLIYVICIWLRIVVSNTYCVVYLFCFVCVRLMYPMVSVSLDCTLVIILSVFSNVYTKIKFSLLVRYKSDVYHQKRNMFSSWEKLIPSVKHCLNSRIDIIVLICFCHCIFEA
jgi:hypothetical protein